MPGGLDQPCGCGESWHGELVAGNEIDCRGLNFPGAPNGTGDTPVGIPGLDEAGRNWFENGYPGRAWLLDADDVGIGGEKGSDGYCTDACREGLVVGGDTDGSGGSSSAKDTPRARSLASWSSST